MEFGDTHTGSTFDTKLDPETLLQLGRVTANCSGLELYIDHLLIWLLPITGGPGAPDPVLVRMDLFDKLEAAECLFYARLPEHKEAAGPSFTFVKRAITERNACAHGLWVGYSDPAAGKVSIRIRRRRSSKKITEEVSELEAKDIQKVADDLTEACARIHALWSVAGKEFRRTNGWRDSWVQQERQRKILNKKPTRMGP